MAEPLSTLLSQVLVAFTIEFDNEFEHRMPHRTTRGPSGRGPWLVSQAMWANFMQYVPAGGAPLRELEPFAQLANLAGLERWRYITITPEADPKAKPPRGIVQPTASGVRAQDVWRPLAGLVEQRWRERFGESSIDELRESLSSVIGQLGVVLPTYLPVVWNRKTRVPVLPDLPATDDLSALVARALLALTLDYERDSELPLHISANVLRVLSVEGERVRDLPALTGVSKEAIAMSSTVLATRELVVVQADPLAPRTKLARLTSRGVKAQRAHHRRLANLEATWREAYGGAEIGRVRAALEALVDADLWRGLEPYPDGWRAAVPRPKTLPHHPMVLHRGGFPDGS